MAKYREQCKLKVVQQFLAGAAADKVIDNAHEVKHRAVKGRVAEVSHLRVENAY